MMRNWVGRRLAVWLLPALLIGVLGLAACSTSTSTQTQPTPTPTLTAQQILQNAGAVDLKDYAFTFAGTETATGQTLNLNGSAQYTKSPLRLEMQVTLPYSGAQLSASLIVDVSTSTVYIKFGQNSLGIPANVWYKGSTSGTLGSFSSIASQLSSSISVNDIKNPTLVGSETINGVAVWHVRGTTSTGATPTPGTTPATSATVDAYFRQDNYYPVKAVIAGSGTNLTINFTSVNTGLTIALPSNAQPFPLG
jgi:hypothetical protein